MQQTEEYKKGNWLYKGSDGWWAGNLRTTWHVFWIWKNSLILKKTWIFYMC